MVPSLRKFSILRDKDIPKQMRMNSWVGSWVISTYSPNRQESEKELYGQGAM